MKKDLIKAATVNLILICSCIEVQGQFRVEAQLRNRIELRNGYQKLVATGSTPLVMVSQRTRLSFLYESENVRLKITPQDVRIWGGDSTVSSTGITNNTTVGIYEAYAEVRLGKKGWVSAGRQALKYDNERIFSIRNWNQNGLTYDALLFKLKFKDWNLHIGGTWNTLKDASSENLYPTARIKTLDFIWLNRKFSECFNLSLVHVAAGATKTDTTNEIFFRQTSGFYTEYKSGKISFSGDAYLQYGKNRKGIPVKAFLADAELSYKVGKLSTGTGLSYLSGNSKTGAAQTTDHLFDPFYGARHKFFGLMDYYSSFSSVTKQGGLGDYYFFLDYAFSKKAGIRNIFHYFRLAQTNPTSPSDKNLGFENDLVVKYNFNDKAALECSYMFYLPTESLRTMQEVKDTKYCQFFYVQLTVTPVLFK